MQADAVERIAEDNRAPKLRVEEGLDAEMIPGTEHAMFGGIPDREREVAEEMRDTVLAPGAVRTKNQLRVGGVRTDLLPSSLQIGREIGPRIDARVGDDPAPAVECEWLLVGSRVVDGLEPCVTEADVRVRVQPLAIRTPKTQVLGHPREQRPIDGRAVEIYDADNAAHPRRGVSSAE